MALQVGGQCLEPGYRQPARGQDETSYRAALRRAQRMRLASPPGREGREITAGGLVCGHQETRDGSAHALEWRRNVLTRGPAPLLTRWRVLRLHMMITTGEERGTSCGDRLGGLEARTISGPLFRSPSVVASTLTQGKGDTPATNHICFHWIGL